MKTICFLAFGTFPILSHYDSHYDMGGSELQQVLIGKELVRKGYNVVFIDFDYGQNQFELVDGIRVIKTFKTRQKTNIWEYIFHIHTLLYALSQSKADIFYQRSGINLIPLLYAKIVHKPFIYAIPHDPIVDLTGEVKSIIRFLWNFDLLYADHIVVQSDYQKQKLQENFKKKSTLIKSICVLDPGEVKKNQTPSILWVATLRELKQPQIYLDLARQFSSVEFYMIGGPSPNVPFFNDIKSEAERIKNLRFLGFTPYDLVGDYFKRAWVFVNTSTVEGFPNTFFQAWSARTPVLSLNVDPDEVICTHKLGFHSGNFSQMVKDLDVLLKDDTLRNQMGLQGWKYVTKEHNVDLVIHQYIDLIESAVE